VLSNDRGSLSFDARVVSDMVDGVVWVPTKAPRKSVAQHLAAAAGDLVRIAAPQAAAATEVAS
jgi:NADH-quinone oxidoreductase subunit G